MSGHIVKRGKHSYSIVLEVGEPGSRKQKWISGFRLKKDAEDEMTDLLSAMRHGTYIEPVKMTVGEWLTEWETKHALALAAGSKKGALITIAKVREDIGGLLLQRLTTAHLETLYAQWHEQGAASSTIGTRHNHLHSIFAKAEDRGLIVRNPCRGASRPRMEYKEARSLDAKQRERLMGAVRETSFFIPVLLAFSTGMRQGEILALRWRDVDYERSCLRVVRNLEQASGLFKEPKTRSSRRVVDVPATVLSELTKHKKVQDAQRLLMGSRWQDLDLVCTRADGAPLSATSLSSRFSKWAKDRGFDITFHGLRHTHASHLLENGVDLKVTQERLGHASLRETADTYSHVGMGMGKAAAAGVDEMLASTLGSESVANRPAAVVNACN